VDCESGSPALAAEADALAERLREGRFFVVAVGRGARTGSSAARCSPN
jgi:hypothetical protein